jgi:hypothetical protein
MTSKASHFQVSSEGSAAKLKLSLWFFRVLQQTQTNVLSLWLAVNVFPVACAYLLQRIRRYGSQSRGFNVATQAAHMNIWRMFGCCDYLSVYFNTSPVTPPSTGWGLPLTTYHGQFRAPILSIGATQRHEWQVLSSQFLLIMKIG